MLARLAAGSVQGTVALGRHRGRRLRRLGNRREPVAAATPGSGHAQWKGYDLHAGLVVPAGQRERLERVCHDALRPPVTSGRLGLTDEGAVRLQRRQPWADGTTHAEFDPVEFLRLIALIEEAAVIGLTARRRSTRRRCARARAALPRTEPSGP